MTIEPVDRQRHRPVGVDLAGLARAAAAGAATGGFAAWAYYDHVLNPVAHVFGLWIALLAVLSARREIRAAVARSTVGLMAAVIAFYVGKKLMYGVDYPGMPYSLNVEQIAVWLFLALVAGTLFGAAFSFIGTGANRGAAAGAAAIGLLLADAYRRSTSYPDQTLVVAAVALVGIIAILAVGTRHPRDVARTFLWAIPLTPLALLVVSAPDALEQVLLTGGF